MPSALRSVQSDNHDGPGTTTTFTCVAPAGIIAGDILVAGVFLGAVTTTTVTASETWDGNEGDSLTSGADPFYIFYKIATAADATLSAASGVYTWTSASARRSAAIVMGCWDSSLLTPTPADPPTEPLPKEEDETIPAHTNSLADALGILVLAIPGNNNRVGQFTLGASGWDLLVDDFGYGQPGVGAGDLGREAHIALLEKYDDDDFDAVTWTTSTGTAANGGWGQVFYGTGFAPPSGQGGTAIALPLRKFTSQDLPYDLRTVSLKGPRSG